MSEIPPVLMTITTEQFNRAIAEAKKQGAVEALTYAAEIARRSAAEMAAITGGPVVEGVVLGLAASLNQYADQIETGEATL